MLNKKVMILLLSPAKIQNFKTLNLGFKHTIPEFLNEAEQLIDLMRDLSASELSKLLETEVNLSMLIPIPI